MQPSAIKIKNLGSTITKGNLKAHKTMNKAAQEELKTKQAVQKTKAYESKVQQEALKTQGIAEKVDQEKHKTEHLKAQTQLMSTGKGLLVLGALVGGYFFLTKVLMKDHKK